MLPASGTTIGRYVIFDLLGKGGMGAVFRAWDDALDRIVALKILLPSSAMRPDARARFLREARLAARVNHPAVAHIYDVGEHEGTPFIAMEFVPGRQLRADMVEPQEPSRAVFLARQILDGLGEAHRQGIVHRDLKPENILLSGRDQVKILDFGLAKPVFEDPRLKVAPTVGLAGTPRYMAPEQLQGRDVDRRADLYSLGAVLYELLTAAPAHAGDSFVEIARSVLEGPPPNLDHPWIPRPLAETIERAMEREPEQRFPSAEDMRAALDDVPLEDEPPEPPTQAHAYLPHPRARVLVTRARDQLIGFGRTNALQAVELSGKAVEIDAQYALAHAIHAESCASVFAPTTDDAVWLDRAERSLEAAERLDPALPDLRVARAKMLWNKTYNFPAETALRELSLAIRSDPHNTGALRLWASITGHLGLVDLLRPALDRRLEDDPNDHFMAVLKIGLHLQQGEISDAWSLLAPLTRLDPAHDDAVVWWLVAHTQLLAGEIDAANAALDATIKVHPEEPGLLSLLALADALEGDKESVRALEKQAIAATKAEAHPHHAFHHLALAHSVLGNSAEATRWLKRTADEGYPCWAWFETDPFLANLRASPEGAALMRELGRRHAYFRREFRWPVATRT